MPRTAKHPPGKQTAARLAPTPSIQTIALVSLGCPKNLVDSEKMLGLLAESGLIPTSDHSQADAIVINTCGFLDASKIESIQEIQQAAKLKKTGSCKRIVVAGCLVQRHRAKMLDWCPDIDALIGVFDRDRIVAAVTGAAPTANKTAATPLPIYSSIAASDTLAKRDRGIKSTGYHESDSSRLRLTPRHYAYLRISEGCNQNCTFCTIPSIRGKMRSKPVPEILSEATELIADGAFELNLIGQDTTSFGNDINYQPGLVGMLTALDKLIKTQAGTGWARLMYAYPSCFTDDMIDAIARLDSVVKYIDMPLQHISDAVLHNMRRNTTRKQIQTLLDKLHRRIPGIAIRTTFISGFPGETEKQHKELVEFIRNFDGFEALGVFPYSPEPGTPAGSMHAQGQAIPNELIQHRIEEIMLTQQQLVFARNQKTASAGTEIDVLIDAPSSGQLASKNKNWEEPAVQHNTDKSSHRKPFTGKLYTGRTYRQAPQIDSVTYVISKQKLAPGELVRCKIIDSDGYDLIANPTIDLERTVPLQLA